MTNIRLASATTCGILGGALLVSFLLPKEASVPTALAADPAPTELVLGGMVRDFLTSHADFAVTPVEGIGHYAGTVRRNLSVNGVPIFDTNGFKVTTQWSDSSGRSIAPHMAGIYGGFGDTTVLGARVNNEIELKDDSMIDSFNSNVGPYGLAGNYGGQAYVSTNMTKKGVDLEKKSTIYGTVYVGPGGDPDKVVNHPERVSGGVEIQDEAFEMPEIVVPDDLEGNKGDVTYAAVTERFEGTDLLADDPADEKALLFDKLTLTDGAILEIEGDVRVVCDEFKMDNGAQIVLVEPAFLSIYVTGEHDLHIKKSFVNAGTAEPDTSAVTLLYLANKKVKVEDASTFLGTIVAPQGELEIKKSQVLGAYVGDRLKLDQGELHVDMSTSEPSAANAALTVHEKLEIKDNSVIDGFDSEAGPYGGTNVADYAMIRTNAVKKDKVKVDKSRIGGDVIVGPGGDPDEVVDESGGGLVTGAKTAGTQFVPIPNILAPLMGASLGDVEWKDGTHVISGDFRAKKLKLEGDVIVQIDGPTRIRLDDKLEMKNNAQIVLNPGATLDLFVEKDVKMEDDAQLNMNTGDPKLVRLGRVSVGKKGKIEVKGGKLSAWVQGRKTELKVTDGGEFFGSFAGRKAKIEKASWHVDMAGLFPCVVVTDTMGVAGADDSGGITSDATFDQWYRNDGTVNLHGPHRITLTKDAFDAWVYTEPAFYPVDGMLLGNEGDVHNFNFTYAIKADFTYKECGGQFIELRGGDGFWLYVNGKLAMDLGGSHGMMDQFLDIDRLGLSPDESYTFELFFAQRDPTGSLFHLRTNLDLDSDRYMPAEHVMFD